MQSSNYYVTEKTSLIPLNNTPSDSLSSKIINEICQNKTQIQSKITKVFKYTAYCIYVPVCYASLLPNIQLALSLKGVYGAITAMGIGFNYGTFGTWGFVSITEKILDAPSTKNEKTGMCIHIAKLVVKVFLSFMGGVLTRMPSAGVALVVSPNIPIWLRLLTANLSIVRASTEIYSLYETLNYIEEKCSVNICVKDLKKTLNVLKENLSVCIDAASTNSIKLSYKNRKEMLALFTDNRNLGINIDNSKRINRIFEEITLHMSSQDAVSNLLTPIRKVAVLGSGVASTLLLVKNGFLTYSALDFLFPGNPIPNAVLSSISAVCFGWVSYKYCAQSADNLVQKMFTLCTNEGKKTFGETFYPITSIIGLLLRIAFSSLPYGEVTAITDYFVNPNTVVGTIFRQANFMAVFLLSVHAMEALFEAGIEKFSESSLADPKIQEAALLINKFSALKKIIQESALPELIEFLNDVGDENLRKILSNSSISLNDLSKILKQPKDPILFNKSDII